jgi:hypothetical protein
MNLILDHSASKRIKYSHRCESYKSSKTITACGHIVYHEDGGSRSFRNTVGKYLPDCRIRGSRSSGYELLSVKTLHGSKLRSRSRASVQPFKSIVSTL